MQNTHFSGLTRKNPVFERSVLKYVSIKNRILTPSGQKSRVCVNALDRLLPLEQRTNLLLYFSNFSQAATIPTSKLPCNFRQILPFSGCDQKLVVTLPSLNSPERSEGDGRCWANLQNTHFSGLTRKNLVFKRSVLKYVSSKNQVLTQSGQKSRVCVNQPDRLLHPFRVGILSLPVACTAWKPRGGRK